MNVITSDTQVLTQNGFKPVSKLNSNDQIGLITNSQELCNIINSFTNVLNADTVNEQTISDNNGYLVQAINYNLG